MSYNLKRRKSKPSASKKCTDVTYTVSNLPSLRRKRTIAYNRIAKALEIGTSATTDDSQVELFLSYCEEISNIAASFQESHLVISDVLGDDADDSEDDIQERFDEAYFRVVSILRKFQPSSSQQPDNSRQNSTVGSHSSNMRLPKITLPTFSGAIKEWPEFIATYNALIHESTQLCEIEKFHYLLSVLRGDALSLIRTFPVANEHYLSAYDALKSRYEDKRELAFTCWRDILDVSFKTSNAQDFRHALDTIDENLTILKQLQLPTEHWDFVLCHNILAKLDPKLRREFEEKHTDVEMPQYKQIRAYLHSKCEAMMRDTHFTAVTPKSATTTKEASGTLQKPNRHNVTHTLLSPIVHQPTKGGDKQELKVKVSETPKFIRKCSFCGDEHHISLCKAFLAKSVDERMAVTAEKKWCYNCLNASHSVRQCTSIFSCQKCKRKHHTLLHREQATNNSESSSEKPSSVVLLATQSSVPSSVPSNTTVLLATAFVQIRDVSGEFQTFRALFDPGSQNNFLTTHAAQRLKLKPAVTNDAPCGLGGVPAAVSGQVVCDLGANETVHFRLEMFVSHNICGDQPIARLNTSGWDKLKTLTLADPGFDNPGPIDVLLAADVFLDSLLDQRLTRCVNKPRAINSVFGWLILGRTRLASSCLLTGPSPNADDSLNNLVQRSWEIDTVAKSSRLTPDEQLCEPSFTDEQYRDETGRYTVCLPFKDNAEPLFEGSRDIALPRFHATDEKRLSRDPYLKQQYVEFMTDYREHEVVFMADVHPLYRPINVASHHRDYQRILWRAHPNEPLQEYVLNTVTYGVSLAPFLACRTVQQLAIDEGTKYSKVKTVLTSDTYIDDIVSIVTGSSSLEDARDIQSQVIDLFSLSSFELRQWVSIRTELLSDLPMDACLSETITFTDAEDTTIPYHTNHKVLSLKWEPASDSFVFNVQPSNQEGTKRPILSEVARIFDRLEFLSPLTVQAKALIQKPWILGTSWDKSLPPEIVSQSQWTGFYQQLPQIRVSNRLELCTAVLFVIIIQFVKDTLRLPINETYLWCDLIITLAWFRARSSRWVTFGANRVSHVQDFVPTACWSHVPSQTKPADICSRGRLPQDLLTSILWWAGPEWLSPSQTELPSDLSRDRCNDNVVLSEQRTAVIESIHRNNFYHSTFKPLCSLSSDFNDLNVRALPGHFLTLELLTAFLDSNYTDVKLNLLDRWQLIQAFQRRFWKRWKNEYLQGLTQRAKWTKDSTSLAVSFIVLILRWPLGRIVTLHNVPDGVVRVATVKIAGGHLVKRPLVKLCPLPSE